MEDGCGTLPGVPLLQWDSLPALHTLCRVISLKCSPDQDILLLKAFLGEPLSLTFRLVYSTGSSSCRPGSSLHSPCPSLCLQWHLHLLSPVLPGFVISVKKQFKTERSTSLILFQFLPPWVRGTGGARIYIHMPLFLEIIYLRNLFP